MRSSVKSAAVKENISDEKERIDLANDLRRFAVLTYVDTFTTKTTNTATPMVLWVSDTMPTSSVWDVELNVVAEATDGSAAAYRRVARVKRGAGAPSLLATATPIADFEDVVAWDVAVSVSGSSIQLAVTGDVLRVVSWKARVEIHEVAL